MDGAPHHPQEAQVNDLVVLQQAHLRHINATTHDQIHNRRWEPCFLAESPKTQRIFEGGLVTRATANLSRDTGVIDEPDARQPLSPQLLLPQCEHGA